MIEHDGCIDCAFELNKENVYPCCECRGTKPIDSEEYKNAEDHWKMNEEASQRHKFIAELDKYCSIHKCSNCAIEKVSNCAQYSFQGMETEELRMLYGMIGASYGLNDSGKEMVNHPKHYTDCSIECIEGMRMAFGDEYTAIHCIITAFKYIWRHDHKENPKQDIEKAEWYIKKADELTIPPKLADRYYAIVDVLNEHKKEFE